MRSIVAGKDCFVSMGRGYLTENDLESLSTREYEAFFGKEAQRILGYSEPKILKKTNVEL